MNPFLIHRVDDLTEYLKVQRIMLEKQALLYGRMMEFFEKGIKLMGKLLDRQPQDFEVEMRRIENRVFVPCKADTNIADSYVSL